MREIHSEEVSAYLNSRPPNRVLDIPPPDISPEEQSLPRPFRTTLSQLRSGFSSKLQSYRHRIGQSDSPLCPERNFACPAAPTPITPSDLWSEGVRSGGLFVSLPPREERPPRPPLNLPPPLLRMPWTEVTPATTTTTVNY